MPFPSDALSGLHVVVVDDNADAREILRRVLAYFGALVTLAASANEALDVLTNLVPNVVITDMYLDPGDGRDVLRAARALGVRAPFIAVSSGDFDT
jgi:CheY-like chemotaxis protein